MVMEKVSEFFEMKLLLSLMLFIYTIFVAITASAQVNSLEATVADHCKAGERLLREYQFEEAIEAFQKCYNLDTLKANCLEKMAYCNYQLGRLKEAKRNYLLVVNKDTANTVALNQLGSIYLKEGRYQESLNQYLKLIELDSNNSFYYKNAAGLLLKQQDFEGAISLYQYSLQLNPQDITVIADLSNIFESMDLIDLADSLIAEGLALDSANIRLLMSRSRVNYKRKDYKALVEGINELLVYQPDSSAYVLKMLGIGHFHLRNFDKSILLLKKIIERGKETEFIHYYLGLAFRSAGELEKSAFHFEQAIKNGISENISIYYTNLGISYEELQNYGESIKAYQAAYKSSRDKKLLFHLARNYDTYYSEKKTALLYYEKFLAENDTGNVQLRDYSEHRISELKNIIHFDLDTLQ